MTGETTLTQSEIFKITGNVYANYINLFQNDKIDFHEFSIIENAIMKINIQIKEKGEKKEEKND